MRRPGLDAQGSLCVGQITETVSGVTSKEK